MSAADRPGLRDVELPAVPGLGGLYLREAAKTAWTAIASAVPGLGQLGRARRDERPTGLDDDILLPDVAYRVTGIRADAARLTEYQHLLGESSSDALPPGFVHVLAFPVAIALMARPGFPLPLLGTVHLANTVEQRRALRLGDELEIRAWAQGLRAHRRGTQVDLVTEVRVTSPDGPGSAPRAHGAHEQDDAPAWRGVSTYLAKGVHLSLDEGVHPTGDEPDRTDGAAAGRTFEPPVPTGRWRLAADTGRRYAAVSGDRNPIHLSRASARAFGFRSAIAHGMYTASRALADVGPGRGDTFTWTVAFAAPVLLPGSVATHIGRLHDRAPSAPASAGAPGAPAPSGAGGSFEYAVWDPRTGRPHLTGTVTPLDDRA